MLIETKTTLKLAYKLFDFNVKTIPNKDLY